MKHGFGSIIMFIIGLNIFLGFLSAGFAPVLFIFFVIFLISGANKGSKGNKSGKAGGFRGKKLNDFNRNIKLYFEDHESLQITDTIFIKPEKTTGTAPYQLYVYYGEERICKIEEFSKYYPKTYMDLLERAFELALPTEYAKLSKESKSKVSEVRKETVDTSKTQSKSKEKTVKKDSAVYFIKTIDDLNIQIKEETITRDLFQTTAMLKQIQMIEEKYPESHEKLVKLYQYYLPILVDILESYVKLLTSNSGHSEMEAVELKLRKTIVLVNEALKTITMQLCEDEIVDMKSDMSVLETILRKDGLVKDGTLYAEEKSVK